MSCVFAAALASACGDDAEAPTETSGSPEAETRGSRFPVPDNLGDFDPAIAGAVRTALAALTKEPEGSREWFALGRLYDAHHLYELAAECYEKATSIDPAHVRAWYGLAFVRGELGELRVACDTLAHVFRLDDRYAPACTRLGFWRLELGEVSAAQAAFSRALSIDVNDRAARLGLARVRLAAEEWQRAVDLLEPLAGGAGDAKQARYANQLLARAYRGLGRMEDASRASAAGIGGDYRIEDGWRQEVEDARVLLHSSAHEARRLIEAGDKKGALELTDALWGERPEKPQLLLSLAVNYREAGELAKSEEVLRYALDRRPGFYPAHFELGRTVFATRKRNAEALGHAKEALTLNPTYAPAHALSGELHAANGEIELAVDAFGEAARCDPDNLRFRYEVARYELLLERWSDAVSTLEDVTQRAPNHATSLRQLGVAYLELERLEDAEKALASAHELAPADKEIEAAMRRLDEAKKAREDS